MRCDPLVDGYSASDCTRLACTGQTAFNEFFGTHALEIDGYRRVAHMKKINRAATFDRISGDVRSSRTGVELVRGPMVFHER
jgi:hypothetical protein